MSGHFDRQFRSFIAAQYGKADPSELSVAQRLHVEDAFWAGVTIGFFRGLDADDAEAAASHREIKAFGERIVQRYIDAGLPLGQRPS